MRRLALAVLFLARIASAADFRVEGETLLLDGTILRGDADTFRGMLGSNPDVKRVSINSPGGDLLTGLKLGEIIRERKLETYVEGGVREAASAAAYAFMGGQTRVIKGTRGVGVHAFYTPATQVRAMVKQKSGDELVATLNEFERSTQESTMAVVEYVIAMIGDTRIVAEAVKSGSDAMLWLGTDRLIDMKVATKKVELRPDEIPDADWAFGETVTALALWLTPDAVGPNAGADERPLDERERSTLEAYLANESAQAALRSQIESMLAKLAPPNRPRARDLLVAPAVQGVVRSVRASVQAAREQESSR